MKIGNVEFNPPVMNAACSAAKSLGDVRALCATNAGAVVVGSITVLPRVGNPQPRWFDTGLYALNSFGLPNEGAETYKRLLPKMVSLAHTAGKPLILSIAGNSTQDYVLLSKLAESAQVDIIELNLGCPNTEGSIISFEPQLISDIIAATHGVTNKPLMVKFSPYSNPQELARVAKQIADSDKVAAVVTSNTFPSGYLLSKGRPALASGFAGISGRAMLPIALGQVRQFRTALPKKIKIIGVGGIETLRDTKLYFQVGADAVQAATLIVRDGHAALNRIIATRRANKNY